MIRRAACTLGALLLGTPVLLGLSATAALAEGSFSAPTPDNGAVLSGSFQVKAATTRKGTSVSLTGPGGYSASRSSSTAITASSSQAVTLDTVDPTSFPNGTWTAKVSSGESRSFYSSFKPATPSGFSASTTDGNAHDVVLTWSKGSEPDLQGYVIYDGSGGTVDTVTVGSACDASACRYALYYDNPKPGTYTYTYSLAAYRTGGCATAPCPDVASDRTEGRTAALKTPAPPAPSPAPKPSSGSTGGGTTGTTGGGSSTTGGSTTGGTTGGSTGTTTGSASNATTGAKTSSSPGALPTLDPVAVKKRAFALGFSNFGASLGIPKLPPLPVTTPQLPSGTGAIPSGTFKPQLPYADETETTASRSFVKDPLGAVTSIDTQQLAKSLAIALILILAAAHLRRWVGVHVED